MKMKICQGTYDDLCEIICKEQTFTFIFLFKPLNVRITFEHMKT